LRAERRRGVGGHWSYDFARHVELLRVYKRELAALRSRSELEAQSECRSKPPSR
jgi:phage terminase Nu1 subunit (DNA packaging protein)